MRKLPQPRPCEHCGEIFQPGPRANMAKFCKKPECQEEKDRRARKKISQAKIAYNLRKTNGEEPKIYKKRGVEIKKYHCQYVDEKGRRCRNWSVNRIYCPGHHSLVSDGCAYEGV